MKQIIGAGFSRDVRPVLAYLQGELGTVPVLAFSEVKVEVMHFFDESGPDVRMLRQKPVEERGAALLCSDHEKVGQRSHWSSAQSANVPDGIRPFGPSLHPAPDLGVAFSLRGSLQASAGCCPRKFTVARSLGPRLTALFSTFFKLRY